MRFALLSGQSIFANNCAMCHGAGGGGNPGYPNLTAGVMAVEVNQMIYIKQLTMVLEVVILI